MPNPNPKINPDAQFQPGNAGGPGRPTVDPEGNTKLLKVLVSDALTQWLSIRAGKRNVSGYVRDVLLKHQEETEKHKP